MVRHQVQESTFRTQRAMGCSITSTARALPRTRHILNPVGSHWTMCLPWYNGTTASSDAAETHRVYVSHTHHAHISAHAHTRLSVDSLCLQKIDTYNVYSFFDLSLNYNCTCTYHVWVLGRPYHALMLAAPHNA